MALRECGDRGLVDAVSAARAAPVCPAHEALVRVPPRRCLRQRRGLGVSRTAAGELLLKLQLVDADTLPGEQHRECRGLAVVAERLLHDRQPILRRDRSSRHAHGATPRRQHVVDGCGERLTVRLEGDAPEASALAQPARNRFEPPLVARGRKALETGNGRLLNDTVVGHESDRARLPRRIGLRSVLRERKPDAGHERAGDYGQDQEVSAPGSGHGLVRLRSSGSHPPVRTRA